MASLMELVERVNKGESIDPAQLEIYEESPNSAEKFLAHHAHALLELRGAQQHMLQSLEAIDYSDQKVLSQFISVSGFLGMTGMRTGPVIKFGASAISRREHALGLEAIQNGIAHDLQHEGTYCSDRENCLFVAGNYERAAQAIAWQEEQAGPRNNKQMRIAYVVSNIADDEPSARTILSLARHHNIVRCKFNVYSTEAGVRREKQQYAQAAFSIPSARRGKETIELLGRQKIATWMAPIDGDVVTAAQEMAAQMARDRIDVVIFDTTQADAIAAMLANWNVGQARINLCRKTPMYAAGIQSICYLDPARFEADSAFWEQRNTDARFLLEGIDTDDLISPAPQRSLYGIPDNAVVMATVGNDLDRSLSEDFVETMINVLRAHPHGVYLVIGEADLGWQKRKFEAAGVSKRVGYAGRRRDLPGFLRIADLYVAEFAGASATGVLQAMSVNLPIIAMRAGESIDQSQVAELVGAESAIGSRDTGAYIELASKLMREPQFRQKLGESMRARVNEQFAFSQTTRQLEQLCEQLIQQNAPGESEAPEQRAQVA